MFSTVTTEPSTAPLTPPPELAYFTTPSSPDVPYARFLSSAMDIIGAGKENGVSYLPSSYAVSTDLRVNCPLYPASSSSSQISPASGTPRTRLSSPFLEHDNPSQWGASTPTHGSPCSRNESTKLPGLDSSTTRNFLVYPDSYFYPATSAQFHLDQVQQPFPNSAGKLTISREADVYSSCGSQQHKTCKQDVEEIEAYRASFGFSADEITTSQNCVELSDPLDESFTISPFNISKTTIELSPVVVFEKGKKLCNFLDRMSTMQECGTDRSNLSNIPPGQSQWAGKVTCVHMKSA